MPASDTLLIACGSLEPEIETVLQRRAPEERPAVRFLDQNLHRHPEKLRDALQDELAEAGDRYRTLVLGYGLCSNGVIGLTVPSEVLYVPKVHDCIALYLGSRDAYEKSFRENPGCYYLTRAWLDLKKDPLGLMHGEYTQRVGEEIARECIEDEFRYYSEMVWVEDGAPDAAPYRERVKENARFLNKRFSEQKGSLQYFEKLVYGPYPEGEFLRFNKDETIKQLCFLK